MMRFVGKAVSEGIAFGRVSVWKRQDAVISPVHVEDIAAETERLHVAKNVAMEQLRAIFDKTFAEVGAVEAQIFEIHMMMLDDENYIESIKSFIADEQVNAEYAVSIVGERFAKRFADIEDDYIRERAADIQDISNRLIQNLYEGCAEEGKASEQEDFLNKEKGLGKVVCAEDLTPSETASLDRESVVALITTHGSFQSHTAILARSMGIPAVVGVTFPKQLAEGTEVIVDGFTGEIYWNPDESTKERLTLMQAEELEKRHLRNDLIGKETVTLDGKRIFLGANIENASQVEEALANDAEGIGLFRSEFLYLERENFPTEEEQFVQYRRVLECMKGKKVIIRTLDIGADKQAGYWKLEAEENPALGCRGIRLSLMYPAIFKTQLRALYRASVYGRLGILFPMITSVNEVEQVLQYCKEVCAELRAEGIAYAGQVELGIMIETPGAAVISDRLAPMVDFFSVGTNDLTQYTLACDRRSASVEPFCDTHHEAILRLIELAAKNAHEHGKWIGICGELAADTGLIEEFVKMGIDELSVAPGAVLKVREKVRALNIGGRCS